MLKLYNFTMYLKCFDIIRQFNPISLITVHINRLYRSKLRYEFDTNGTCSYKNSRKVIHFKFYESIKSPTSFNMGYGTRCQCINISYDS